MDSSKILEDDLKSKHSKQGNNDNDESKHQSGDGSDGSGGENGGEEEEILINEEEMRKLKQAFKRLSKNTTRIRIEEAHIIAKNISDDIMFPEFEIFEILQDEEVNATRKLSERNFIYLIEVIKKRQNQSNEADTLLAYVAMGGD